MIIMHLLSAGDVGGIEKLIYEYAKRSKLNNIFVFIFRDGYYANKLRQEGYEVVSLCGEEKNAFRTMRELLVTVRKYRPGVLVDHHGAPLTRYSLYMIRKLRLAGRILSYMHSNASFQIAYGKGLKGRLINFSNVLALHVTDQVIAISNSVKKSVIDYWGYQGPIEVIYNGISLEKSDSSLPVLDRKHIKLMYVGRLIQPKGVQNIISILDKLDYDVELIVVGDGEYRSDLEQLSRTIKSKVTFLGVRDDVHNLLKQATVFIHLPECDEGFGIAVAEAMAAGCLCVCYAAGGITEIIDDKKDGILVSNGNVDEAARSLNLLLAKIDSKEVQEMRQLARIKAQQFSLDSFAEKMDATILYS